MSFISFFLSVFHESSVLQELLTRTDTQLGVNILVVVFKRILIDAGDLHNLFGFFTFEIHIEYFPYLGRQCVQMLQEHCKIILIYLRHNILRSMSRKGTPADNLIIEALNGWMKKELYLDFGLSSPRFWINMFITLIPDGLLPSGA